MDQVAGRAWETTRSRARSRGGLSTRRLIPSVESSRSVATGRGLADACSPRSPPRSRRGDARAQRARALGAHRHAAGKRRRRPRVAATRSCWSSTRPVDASLGSLRVFDGQGPQVDAGEVTQPAAAEVAVGIDSELAPGTYTVAWRVVSADSDPISGAFVFHVLERGVGAANVSIDALTGTSRGRGRPLHGGAVLRLRAAPPRRRRLGRPRRRAAVRGLAGAAAALRRPAGVAGGLAVVALVNILLQGATAGGLSLSDAFSWSLFTSVLETDYGEVMLIQSALAATLALTALALRHAEGHDRRPLTALTLALGAGLSLTPSFSGHARTLGGLGLVSDILHVIAAALWTGGLAFLVIALLMAEADRWPLATRAVPRFSNMAVGSVVALLAAGIISAYLQLRTWSALWDNQYGLLVLAKIVLVVPLLALGAYNNRYAVPRLKAGIASVLERRRFLRAAGAELVIMVVDRRPSPPCS